MERKAAKARCVNKQLSHIPHGDLWENMESMPQFAPMWGAGVVAGIGRRVEGYLLPTPICELKATPADSRIQTALLVD